MICKPLKEGDTLFSIPANVPHTVTFGHDNHAFLRFCDNHEKPFGFLWKSELRHVPQCPRCGDGFIPDETRTFVMIKSGYTITQRFRNGVEVAAKRDDVLDSEYIDG